MIDEIELRNKVLPRLKTWPTATLKWHQKNHMLSLQNCDLDKEIGRHHQSWHVAYIKMIGEVLSQKL